MVASSKREPRIYAVVLAAGTGRRFGATKQLVELGGAALVHRAASLAHACCGERSLLVVGHRAPDIIAAADGRCQFLLVNDRYVDGIGTSISLAVRALSGVADAILLLLADQPLLTESDIATLLAAWSGRDSDVVISSFDDAEGPPVLLPRATFTALAALDGDHGARAVLQSGRFRVRRVPCAAAGIDVDTPADVDRLRQDEE